jgi:hypothetical protein
MKPTIYFLIFSFTIQNSFAQNINKLITANEALRLENFLAADSLKGRKVGTPQIDIAADFINYEFKKAGLKHFNNLNNFKQNFNYLNAKQILATATVNGNVLKPEMVTNISTDSIISINEKANFKQSFITKSETFFLAVSDLLENKTNQIIFVDTFFKKDFYKIKRFQKAGFKKDYTAVFVLFSGTPSNFLIDIKNKITNINYTNVVGMLPGKSKKEEYVIFSCHYDHIGVGKPNTQGDSIYNGANDDAAGTAAVILLANYFAKQKNNERSIIFTAFTAEEVGGYGSNYFSNNINADKIVAMFNIEMIGTESKWGKNSAFITGFEKSDFGKILQKNLLGSNFKFEPDPYLEQNLFYRSDNATLAALGVPAHTISTSKMDNEKNYHKQTDEVGTLDLNNMTEIIKAIAISSKTIIKGTDTPTRIEKIKL